MKDFEFVPAKYQAKETLKYAKLLAVIALFCAASSMLMIMAFLVGLR
ncbi:hypothetical protein AH03_14 [Erwinia phage AH03]|uniref:Uncharacterized protein n=1 Tax=Erwinia phage AH03 TaxID=2869568 RepID=A0AAE7X0J9_9CAUD|nr:hypothetical protein AH03_14 [Erwinia phage AH03]